MSPSTSTSVPLAPRFRIEDTGLPSSTGRESTMPSIGDRIVALSSSSCARSTAACDGRHRGPRLRHLGLRDAQLHLGRLLAVHRHLEGAARVVQRLLRDELAREERFGALEVAAREGHVGPRRLDLVLLELRLGRGQVGLGAGERRPRFAQAGGEIVLVELDQHLADRHPVADLDPASP